MLLLNIFIVLFILYGALIIYYWRSWLSISIFIPEKKSQFKISVIIPARNEANNIGSVLQALNEQSYPKDQFEVIVVDDHSTDGMAGIVNQFAGVKLLSLQNDIKYAHKKMALSAGIEAAQGELIVTTDADCRPATQWLETIASFYEQNNSQAVAAPVLIDAGKNFIGIFQCMDFMILQGITAATVHKGSLTMANGANFSYKRSAFQAVEGFSGIDKLASGDDMLLAFKIARKFPGSYHYLLSPGAMVTTSPVETVGGFFSQRIRWASKSLSYDDKRILPVLILVYLFNLSFLVLFIFAWFQPFYWWVLALAWPAKTIIELPFFYSLAVFFRKKWTIPYFFFMQPFHILYTVIAGIAGQLGSYRWKGRTVK